MLETGRELAGNFSSCPSVFLRREGCHEGVLHKPADANLAVAGRACGRNCLSGGSDCGARGSPRGTARSRAHRAEYDLGPDGKFGGLPVSLP